MFKAMFFVAIFFLASGLIEDRIQTDWIQHIVMVVVAICLATYFITKEIK